MRASPCGKTELLVLDHARYVGEVGVMETCHFVFQKKRKVNLVPRAQPLDGIHGSSCPGDPPAYIGTTDQH